MKTVESGSSLFAVSLICGLSLLTMATGCERGANDSPQVPSFEDAGLQQGRTVWLQVCRNCHLLGVAGAPAIDDGEAWRPRIEKGRAALYQSALNGIAKDGGWSMPPRGGKAVLTETQVRRAVDFMLAAVETLQATQSHTAEATGR